MPLTSPAAARTPVPTTRGALQTYGVNTKLEVLVKDLAVEDVIFQQVNTGGRQGSIYTWLEVIVAPVWVGGTFPYQLTVKDIETGEVKTVIWGANGYVNLVASKKLEALAKKPALAHIYRPGAVPKWRGAAAV